MKTSTGDGAFFQGEQFFDRWTMNGRQWTHEHVAPQVCATMPELLGILAGRIRYEIVTTLARGAMSVGVLAKRLELELPHISMNLSTLRRYRIVEATKVERARFYQLTALVECVEEGTRLILRLRSRDGVVVEIHAQGQASGAVCQRPTKQRPVKPKPSRVGVRRT